jgi:hypothetical protein
MNTRISKIGLCLILLGFSPGHAQTESDVVKKLAEESGEALVANDFDKVVDLTYPEVVRLIGGKAKMIATLQNGMNEMKRDGYTIAAFSVVTPGEIIKIGNRRFTVVPYVLKVKVPSGSLITNSFMLGVYEPPQTKWTFVDGRNLNEFALKTLFPDAVGKLNLPKPGPPVFQQN